jgi:hypothetical protein
VGRADLFSAIGSVDDIVMRRSIALSAMPTRLREPGVAAAREPQ